MTLQELAKEALKHYQQSTANRGGRSVTIWSHKKDAPEWIVDMTREAHGDMLPDDWKFKFVVEALDTISEAQEGTEEDALHEWEPDVYSYTLLQWVSSNLERMEYVNEVVQEYGWSDLGLAGALMEGQKEEFEEVGYIVLEKLRERLDELEGDED